MPLSVQFAHTVERPLGSTVLHCRHCSRRFVKSTIPPVDATKSNTCKIKELEKLTLFGDDHGDGSGVVAREEDL